MDSIPFLLAHLIRHGRLDRGTRSEYETCQTALRLAKRVDLQPFFRAAKTLEQLVSILSTSSALHYPQASIETPNGLSGPLIYARKTLLGWILIGSKEANFYGRDDILCIIELGGDDVYAMSPRPNVRLYIDYGGDDHYLGAGGSAIGGIEFLIDYEGDDVYTGDAITQGSSFCGIGCYGTLPVTTNTPASAWRRDALFLGQASSLTEPAMMYSLGHRGQGLGGMMGWGLLADAGGEDFYSADHQAPSAYGLEENMRVGHKEWDSASAAKDLVVSASSTIETATTAIRLVSFPKEWATFSRWASYTTDPATTPIAADVMPKAQVPIRP